MIKKINNFTNKSFKDFTGPDDEFRAKNIIFGYNGSGKTSLVAAFEESFVCNPDNSSINMRVYSSNYISKNLLLDPFDRKKIKGVRAVFGEKDVVAEEEIKKLETKLISEETITSLTKETAKLESDSRQEITKIFNSKKGTSNIKSKQSTLSLDEIVHEYDKDLKDALKVEPDVDKIEKIKGDGTIEFNISLLTSLDELPITFSKITDFERLTYMQEQKYENIAIPSSEIVEWLTDGLVFHSDKNHCEFCGSPIEYEDIKERIDSYSKNAKFEAESFFKNNASALNHQITLLETIISKKSTYTNFIGVSDAIFEEIVDRLNKLKGYVSALENNSKNIINIDKINVSEYKGCCSELDELAVQINKAKQEKISSESKKLEKINVLIKGAVSIAIGQSTILANNYNKIKENQSLLKQYNEDNNRYNFMIKALKESKVVTVDFKNLVNTILEDINISLKLEIEGNDYYLRTTLLEQNELTIDDISEGEKNILSLIFFYFEMFEDEKQTKIKSDIKLIVLDDPISSMDDSNRFYVLEMVKNIIELDVEQVFVLTHVWEDYSQLTFNRNCFKKDSKYTSYEIRKTDKSHLVKNINSGNPYKFMFKEIYDLSLKETLSNDCEYFHIPNVIRKVFEEFLFFKTNKTGLVKGGSQDYIESLFEISSRKDKMQLGSLIRVVNVLSHKNTKNQKDILSAAKFLMKLIKENDANHFNSMKE